MISNFKIAKTILINYTRFQFFYDQPKIARLTCQFYITQSRSSNRSKPRILSMARNDGHACAQRLVNKQQLDQTSMLKFIGVTLGK